MNDKSSIKWVKDHFDEIHKETLEAISEEDTVSWLVHGDTCNDVFGAIADATEFQESGSSMIVMRLFELQNSLLWLQLSAVYGVYRPLIRELRFFLESFAQAHIIDKEMSGKIMEERYDYLEKHEFNLFGKNLITQLDTQEQEEFKKLYYHLSKYEHSSPLELYRTVKRGIVEERFVYYFDKEMFNNCSLLTTSVLDWSFYFSLKTYPNAIQILKSKENLEYWFRKLQYKRTMKLMGIS